MRKGNTKIFSEMDVLLLVAKCSNVMTISPLIQHELLVAIAAPEGDNIVVPSIKPHIASYMATWCNATYSLLLYSDRPCQVSWLLANCLEAFHRHLGYILYNSNR